MTLQMQLSMTGCRRIAVSALLMGLVASPVAVGQRGQDTWRIPSTVTLQENLQYYTGPGADPKFHNFDLYMPTGRTNVPMLFFVHGGGWAGGDKKYEGLDKIVKICAELGMGVMSVNYRLSPAVKHPVHIQDVARGFAWLWENAGKIGANRDAIYLAGGSAGAHLVSLLGLDARRIGEHGIPPTAIKGVVAFSGIHDFTDWPEPGLVPTRAERAFGTSMEILKDASPLSFVGQQGANTPPYLIAYTDDDIFELDKQAQRLYGAFAARRLPAELLAQPGRTHQTKTLGIAGSLDYTEDVLGPAIKRFLTSVMNGTFAEHASAAWYSSLPGAMKPDAPQRTVRILQDLRYGTTAGIEPKFETLDLYLPEGKTNFPILFFVHGGGWRGGDKAYDGLDRIVKICNDLGMGVMSANYRVSPAAKHPAHIEDVARAFAWLHANASKYGADPNRIFIGGGSAGAHLVALLALDGKRLQKHGLSPRHIKGVMAFSGIYDIANFPEPGVVPTRREQAFATREDWIDASAVRYVGKSGRDTPPFLISYTDADIYGLGEQAVNFYAQFVRQRLPAELLLQPGRTHETKTLGIASRLGGVDDVLGPAIRRFLKTVMDGTFAEPAGAAWPMK